MFELYTVPSLAYCVDSIMSFYHNNRPSHGQFAADGLVISFNTASTSVIPILNGKGILGNAKRYILRARAVEQGSDGFASQDSMGFVAGYRVSPKVDTTKVSNVPYPRYILPSQRESITLPADGLDSHNTQWMLQNFCEFSSDYPALLRSLRNPNTLTRSGKIIQFPFSQPAVDEKTEEEQARLTERRREQGKRLQEMAAKARIEKVSASNPSVGRAQHGYISWRQERRTCARCWS